MAARSESVAFSVIGAVAVPLSAAEEVPWTDIPGVRILGAVLGTILLIAAVRSMFGGKG